MIQIVLIAILSLLVQLLLPWWSLAVVAFVICYWRSSSAGRAFLYGFAGVCLVWLIYALTIQLRTDGVYVGRISQLLFQVNNTALLVLVTSLVSGLIGGLAGVSGYFAKQAAGNRRTEVPLQ
jgi:hypothetical protein